MRQLRRTFAKVSEDRLLVFLLLTFPLLLVLSPLSSAKLPAHILALVHIDTLLALTGLMLLSRGIEDSGYFQRLNDWFLARRYSERRLVAWLVVYSAGLAAIITNDVALFIVVPIAVLLCRSLQLPLLRVVIFLALAVNAGSAASPIGNPQNLLLWQSGGLSFIEFTAYLLPLGLLFLGTVLVFVYFAFGSQLPAPAKAAQDTVVGVQRRRLFWGSLLGYPIFIAALELNVALLGVIAIIAAYGVRNRPILLGIDWQLLLVFTLMFINLGLFAQLPLTHAVLQVFQALPEGSYVGSALLSQFISNVPATIYLQSALLQDSPQLWLAVAYGVNVGGFGFILGSMANLIALRLVRKSLAPQQSTWGEFHRWSVPVFIISLVGSYLLLTFIR
ncbi:SLC13 family permease [Aliidiomarina haloalkalitolerans]|uniref:Transporter n=1 Tax=Aliidiomarina haloalkalitolerans TaxID=859059 RepID=A0A432VVT9_9GAMM|nr:SLC13 family permease [Aliidiomarina haloalkalitolerans]RUO20702.1 transporter [Aliidiomarina haloalkalitolerans]